MQRSSCSLNRGPLGGLFCQRQLCLLRSGKRDLIFLPPPHPTPEKPQNMRSVVLYPCTMTLNWNPSPPHLIKGSNIINTHVKVTRVKIKFGNVCFGEGGEAAVFDLTVKINLFHSSWKCSLSLFQRCYGSKFHIRLGLE